jgi:hypothetical protein
MQQKQHADSNKEAQRTPRNAESEQEKSTER